MSSSPDFFANAETDPTLQITNEAEACAAVLFACRRADEIDGPVGTATFLTTLKSRNIFIGSDPQTLVGTVSRYFEQAGSPAALIDAAIGAIREQTRLPLFYHCLDVMLADGIVTPQEHKAFLYLKSKFKLSDEVSSIALEVLMVKNQL